MANRTGELSFQSDLVDPSAWIAANAVLTAHVEVGAKASVWFGAVIRGDSDVIRIGAETNIQDLSCLHADPGFPCILGKRITVGHAAVVHGAEVADECLIGIRATVLTGAKIGERAIVAAGAVVLEGQEVPPRSVVVGVPARVVREVTDADIERITRGADHYVEISQAYKSLG